MNDATAFTQQLKWNEQGLVPAIAQDWQTGEVLMLAWMDRQALELTAQEGRTIYWSRSRGALWRKGEESGHVQQLKELRIDCDADTVLLKVEQLGGIACRYGVRLFRTRVHTAIVRDRVIADSRAGIRVIAHKGLALHFRFRMKPSIVENFRREGANVWMKPIRIAEE